MWCSQITKTSDHNCFAQTFKNHFSNNFHGLFRNVRLKWYAPDTQIYSMYTYYPYSTRNVEHGLALIRTNDLIMPFHFFSYLFVLFLGKMAVLYLFCSKRRHKNRYVPHSHEGLLVAMWSPFSFCYFFPSCAEYFFSKLNCRKIYTWHIIHIHKKNNFLLPPGINHNLAYTLILGNTDQIKKLKNGTQGVQTIWSFNGSILLRRRHPLKYVWFGIKRISPSGPLPPAAHLAHFGALPFLRSSPIHFLCLRSPCAPLGSGSPRRPMGSRTFRTIGPGLW